MLVYMLHANHTFFGIVAPLTAEDIEVKGGILRLKKIKINVKKSNIHFF